MQSVIRGIVVQILYFFRYISRSDFLRKNSQYKIYETSLDLLQGVVDSSILPKIITQIFFVFICFSIHLPHVIYRHNYVKIVSYLFMHLMNQLFTVRNITKLTLLTKKHKTSVWLPVHLHHSYTMKSKFMFVCVSLYDHPLS